MAAGTDPAAARTKYLHVSRDAPAPDRLCPLVPGASPARLLTALLAAALLSAGVYGLAEFLVFTITKPQAFGTLIPAIGATPYILCGAIYPIAVLPVGVKWLTWILPWTHTVSLLRYGLMGDTASGLHQIWPHDLPTTCAALLSLLVLAAFTALTHTAAHRAFVRSTLK